MASSFFVADDLQKFQKNVMYVLSYRSDEGVSDSVTTLVNDGLLEKKEVYGGVLTEAGLSSHIPEQYQSNLY